jgi:hypothetical protein
LLNLAHSGEFPNDRSDSHGARAGISAGEYDCINLTGQTPLEVGVRAGYTDVVSRLLDEDVRVTERVAIAAAESSHCEEVMSLILDRR